MKNKLIAIGILSIGLIGLSFINGNDTKEVAESPAKVGIEVGDLAPDIIMKSPDGEEYKLSDLRGK